MNQIEFSFIKDDIDKVTFIKGDRFDVSDINFRFTNLDKKRHLDSNHLIEKLVTLGKGRYELIIPKNLEEYPYVVNSKTGKKLKLNIDRNQYDAWNIGGVTIAPHKLIGYLVIKNPEPHILDVVNHRNENKKDFRLNNLHWTSNGANVREAQSNKRMRQDPPKCKIESLRKKLKEDLSLDEFFKVCHDVIKLKNKS
jgi:hypothetical protein